MYIKVFFIKISFKKRRERLFVNSFSSSKTSTNRKHRRNLIVFWNSYLGRSNLDGRNFRISRYVLYICVYIFPSSSLTFLLSPIFLYLPPVSPLFFTRTISSATFNLNASFKIFSSLVCRFLNRYVLFFFSTPLHFFSHFYSRRPCRTPLQ